MSLMYWQACALSRFAESWTWQSAEEHNVKKPGSVCV